jgi:hypothetical protein
MRLISNCDMADHAPTDLFDWHMYTDPQNMFDRRHDFDNIPNLQDKQIFASEFGVVSDPPGTPIPFPGNARVSRCRQMCRSRLHSCETHVHQ